MRLATGTQQGRMSGYSRRISLLLLAFLLTALFAEAALRFGGFLLRQRQDRRNSESLKRAGTIKILCLGESTTAGQYPAFLEKTLNAQAGALKFSVIDGGVPGTDTGGILAGLDDDLREYEPAIVVTMLGVNDKGWSTPLQGASIRQKMAKVLRDLRIVKVVRLALTGFKWRKEQFNPAAMETYRKRGYPQTDTPDVLITDLVSRPGWEHYDRGLTLFNEGKMEEAKKAFHEALNLNFDYPNIFLLLFSIADAQGDDVAAENAFQRALKANYHVGLLYSWRGNRFEVAGNFEKAEENYRKALSVAPQSKTEALAIVLARQLLDRGERKNAPPLFLTSSDFPPRTVFNYQAVRDKLLAKGIRLVCVQYPMREIEPLKKVIGKRPGVYFVDNKDAFVQAVAEQGAGAIFRDRFAGDFGHCTDRGNALLAENIAKAVLLAVPRNKESKSY